MQLPKVRPTNCLRSALAQLVVFCKASFSFQRNYKNRAIEQSLCCCLQLRGWHSSVWISVAANIFFITSRFLLISRSKLLPSLHHLHERKSSRYQVSVHTRFSCQIQDVAGLLNTDLALKPVIFFKSDFPVDRLER